MPKFPDFIHSLPAKIRTIRPPRIRSLITRKRVLIIGGVLMAFLIITPVATYIHYARDINDRQRLMNHNNTGIVLKDRSGKVFYQYGHMGTSAEVPLDKISIHLQQALIASEDKDFYTNGGFSMKGMARAIYGDILTGDPTKYGGSTITQQLVKNKLLSSNKNYLRKYQEISMAVAVDRHYSKKDILDMYLNSVYFGEGAFGIADASKTYFNKQPADLSVGESALLVGLLPAPNAYSPISGDKSLAMRGQKRVLNKMLEQHYVSADEARSAETTPLTYADAQPTATFAHAQHYSMMVLDELKKKYGDERVARSGFEVTTTLDLSSQEQAETIVRKRVATYESAGGNNASLVAIDPKTGFVRALVGSVDWNNTSFGQVNMAVTPRQPGSSFKPIYYSYALDKHLITAATILHDKPTTYGDWTPHDVDMAYRGNVTTRQALAQSMNIPAAEVMQKVTPEAASQVATKMGISTITQPEKYGLTLAVGTAEAKLYEMTSAYTTFANEGERLPPVLVTNIQDKYGNKVFHYKTPGAKRIISREAAFVLSSILSDNAARAPLYGSSLNIPGRQAAVKTGTTDSNVDAWTIGYTPSLTVGVWVGNNEHKPMRGLAGGSSAGLIWRDTMTAYTASMPHESFVAPSGVHQLAVCSGGGYSEYFIAGTESDNGCASSNHTADTHTQTAPKEDTTPAATQTDTTAAQDTPAPTSTPPAQSQPTSTNPPANSSGGTPPSGGSGTPSGGGTTTPPPSQGGRGGGSTTPPPSDGSGGSTPPPSGGGSSTPPPSSTSP